MQSFVINKFKQNASESSDIHILLGFKLILVPLLITSESAKLYAPGPGWFYLLCLSNLLDWVGNFPPFNFTTFTWYDPGPGFLLMAFSFRNYTFKDSLFLCPILIEDEDL